MSTIIDGSLGITFPVTAGSASAVQASSGRVLQVVQAVLTGGVSTTSTTLSATGLTASITPSSASNKILVSIQANGLQKASGDVNSGVQLNLYKNGSNVIKLGEYIGYTQSSAVNDIGGAGFDYLDSPATTSSTTYAIYFKSMVSGISVNINAGADISTIVLMEIAA
jgi:hypothetical protein